MGFLIIGQFSFAVSFRLSQPWLRALHAGGQLMVTFGDKLFVRNQAAFHYDVVPEFRSQFDETPFHGESLRMTKT